MDSDQRPEAANTALPAGLSDWLFAALEQRLAGDPEAAGAPTEGASAAAGPHATFPAAWPSRAQALAALASLDRLELEQLGELLDRGTLDRDRLARVLPVFAEARAALVAHADSGIASPAQSLAQALAARDRQLSIATHELRTPISSILLNLQMLERTSLQRGTLDSATVAKLLEVPSRQLRRLIRMVDLLLDTAQVENERLVLQPQPLDLCEVVHDAASRLAGVARQAGCTISLEGCEPVVGRWDRLRIEQVVTNLLTNAIKYGGDRVEMRTYQDGEARIVVRDHGDGIAPDDRQRIFEPFERLAGSAGEEGAGLGLYIVREIVRAHGGRVEVASEPGQGTTFTVSLPV